MTDAYVITLVGDSNIGKSTLITTYAAKQYTGYSKIVVPCIVDDQVLTTKSSFKIIVRDTLGNDDIGSNALMNKLAFPFTDCFVLCYAINNETSFDNLYAKWYKTIEKYQYLSSIVVGLKSDLSKEQNRVTESHAKLLVPLVKAYDLVTCSSISYQNIDLVFSKAVASCRGRKKHLMDKCYCSTQSQ